MTFAALLNENVMFLAILIAFLFFIGIRAGFRHGGWRRHTPYIWALFIYLIYVLITPLYFYSNNATYIIGTDISGYYGLGFLFNAVAILFFIIGYWIKGRSDNAVWDKPPKRQVERPHFILSVMFYGFYGIVLLNLAVGGVNVQEVFLGDEVLGLGASGASYFLQNFTDSLICIIVLAYLFDVPWKTLICWIIAAFFLFSLLGFRYRIMLTLFGVLFVYLYKSRIDAKKLSIGFGLALLFFYGVMFSTVNRHKLILRRYDNMVYNPVEFNYTNFFHQTRGALPDMAIYKLFDNPNRKASYDYGITMFGYVFIRMIPRAIYPDKDKFYPPPQLATTLQAYDAWWASKSGEATLSVGAFYIAFGWMGVILGHFLWGVILRWFGDHIRFADKLQLATYIVIALVSFQWITRGYFPQVIDHAVYMLIPIWGLRYYSKKIPFDENN